MPAPKKSLAATALLTDLITGLWTTLRYTFKPNVTVRYPLERSVLHPNYRGILRVDDDLCIACFLCETWSGHGSVFMEGDAVEVFRRLHGVYLLRVVRRGMPGRRYLPFQRIRRRDV